MKQVSRKNVMIDKNFLQKENASTRWLPMLQKMHCNIVVTDTLVLELATDTNDPFMWEKAQDTLRPFADNVVLYEHVAPLAKREIELQQCCASPISSDLEKFRDQLKRGNHYRPPNFKQVCEEAIKERESQAIESITSMARSFGHRWNDSTELRLEFPDDFRKHLWGKPILDQHVRLCLERVHNKAGDLELNIDNRLNINPSWITYNRTKATLCLAILYLSKYGLNNEPHSKNLANTRHDLDYLTLLYYSDALATEEKKDMRTGLRMMYGGDKKLIRTADLKQLEPQIQDIQKTAYDLYLHRECRHGNDLGDWYAAEAEYYSHAWDRLPSCE